MKPKVFIGSSREAISIAHAIHANLTRDAECTVWNNAFQLSAPTLGELVRNLRDSDFGIFVFSPDDITIMRNQVNDAVRDNVLFELGLFIGRLGQERCFFLVPDNATSLHLPSDLAGVTPGYYEANRSDKNWQAAVSPVCMQIKSQMERLKSFQDAGAAIANAASAVIPVPPPITPAAPVALPAKKTAARKVASKGPVLTIEPYKKVFLIKGDTKPHKEGLKALGARWIEALGGWTITSDVKDQFESDFAALLK